MQFSRLLLATLALLLASAGLQAQAPSPGPSACAPHAAEAARRSGLAAGVILRVMRAESGGNAHAVSRRGAIGCMQIMPPTWRELSARHRLGGDPFDPRMNMIGGALYLAELERQFGFPGAFAAYNSGPGRYAQWRAGRTTLPAETRNYVALLDGRDVRPQAPDPMPRWQDAGLFAAPPGSSKDRSSPGSSVPGRPTLFALQRD